MTRRDTKTLDLFTDYRPPEPAVRFAPEVVRGADIETRLCRAMRVALKGCRLAREEVAERMSAFLGREFSKNMLDAYVSEARAGHVINIVKFAALIHATEDYRLLSVLVEEFGFIVVDCRYEKLIQATMGKERLARARQEIARLEREAHRGLGI
ncbi:MAG: hypothetical protein ACE5EM_01280 [Sphingomonadales bacterium]